MYRFIIILLLSVVCSSKMLAQNDPVLAGMIYAYTDKAEKGLKNQEKIMLMQTTAQPICKRSSTTTAVPFVVLWYMQLRYMASITR